MPLGKNRDYIISIIASLNIKASLVSSRKEIETCMEIFLVTRIFLKILSKKMTWSHRKTLTNTNIDNNVAYKNLFKVNTTMAIYKTFVFLQEQELK